jgi:hypothetical protein
MFPYNTQKILNEERVRDLLNDARVEEHAPEDKGSSLRHLISGLRGSLASLGDQDRSQGDCAQSPSPAK